MSTPLNGTQLGSLVIFNAGGTSPFKSAKQTGGVCADNTGTYAFLSLLTWFNSATTLNGTINSGATSIVLTSASSYMPAGYVRITTDGGAQMLVAYTSITSNTLNGCTGVTATCTSGNVVFQPPVISKIQLSNLTAVGNTAFFWPLAVTPATYPFYDDINSLVLFIGTDNKLYSLPAAGGSLPFTLTQVGSGTLAPIQGSWGGLRYNPTLGIVWNSSTDISQKLYGFWYKDPTGINADFTPVYHPYQWYSGAGTFLASKEAVASLPDMSRIAICGLSTQNHVARWRQDQMRSEILSDASGLTNSSNNGATAGTAISAPTALLYDDNKRLYIFTTSSMYYCDPATEVLSGGPISISGSNSPVYLPSGGWSGGGSGQLLSLGSASNGTLFLQS